MKVYFCNIYKIHKSYIYTFMPLESNKKTLIRYNKPVMKAFYLILYK